jgi:hypothetical protein
MASSPKYVLNARIAKKVKLEGKRIPTVRVKKGQQEQEETMKTGKRGTFKKLGKKGLTTLLLFLEQPLSPDNSPTKSGPGRQRTASEMSGGERGTSLPTGWRARLSPKTILDAQIPPLVVVASSVLPRQPRCPAAALVSASFRAGTRHRRVWRNSGGTRPGRSGSYDNNAWRSLMPRT